MVSQITIDSQDIIPIIGIGIGAIILLLIIIYGLREAYNYYKKKDY